MLEGIKISELPETHSLEEQDYVAVVQDGQTRKVKGTAFYRIKTKVVDNTYDGGRDKALSAEAGKTISEELEKFKAQKISEPTINFINTSRDEDAILIKSKSGETILIDSGERANQNNAINRMEWLNIRRLDYFIITHFHSDHAGGAVEIIRRYNPKLVIYKTIDFDRLPAHEIEWETKRYYEEFIDVCNELNIETLDIKEDRYFNLKNGYESFGILATKSLDYEDYNGCSLIVHYKYNSSNCIFLGDSTQKSQNAYLNKLPHMEFMKMSHHGGYNNTSLNFCRDILPSVSFANGYGLNNFYQNLSLVKYSNNSKTVVKGEKNVATIKVTDGGVILSENIEEVRFSNKLTIENKEIMIKDGMLISNGIVNYYGVDYFVYNGEIFVNNEETWAVWNEEDILVDRDGSILKNYWKESRSVLGSYFYLDENGRMLKNTSRIIGNKLHTFDNSGLTSISPIV